MLFRILIILVFLFSRVEGQYSISGYIDGKEEVKTVYLSLLQYNEEEYLSWDQVLQTTKTDRNGYFEFKGKLLSDKNKLYRVHADIPTRQNNTEIHFGGNNKNYLNFIFSNNDTIVFNPNVGNLFDDFSNTNTADHQLRKLLDYKNLLRNEYISSKNPDIEKTTKDKFVNEIRNFCNDSLDFPLVKLLAVREIEKEVTNLDDDFNNSPDFYLNIQTELSNYYGKDSYYQQFNRKISSITLSTIKTRYALSKLVIIILSFVSITSIIIILVLRSKLRKEKSSANPQEIILTPQEERILKLILVGKSNKDIAAELFISPSTVKTHSSNIYSKLHVSSRIELLRKFKI